VGQELEITVFVKSKIKDQKSKIENQQASSDLKSPKLQWLQATQSTIVNRQSIILWLGLGFITALYLALVLLRHYSFDTHSHDLGLFDQSAWHYSRWEAPYSSIKGYNMLGDHFTFIVALTGPFYWLWDGPETLLVLQVLAVLSGVFPAYWLARQRLKPGLRFYPPYFYALFFGVQTALDFDFHPDSFSVAALMWALWAFEARRPGRYLVFLGLALLGKETIPVYLSFWALYVLTTGRQRLLHVAILVGGLALFFLELNLILPFFAGRPYYYTDYGDLGQSMGEVVISSLRHPDRLFNALFGNETKLATWAVFFISCGGAILVRPALLLLLIPNVIERFLNPSPTRWSLYFHYSLILAPFFTYAVVLALAQYQQRGGRWGKFYLPPQALAGWLALVLLLNTFVYGNFIWHGFDNAYYLTQDRSAVSEALALIPPQASVLASSRLVPHLTHRQTIDELLSPEPPHPELAADYVIISLAIERNPQDRAKLEAEANRFRQRPDYQLIFERDQTLVFDKK
jgi:uncharacterized membrane protein